MFTCNLPLFPTYVVRQIFVSLVPTAPTEASLQESVQMTATMEAVRATAPEEEEESTSVTEDTNATTGNASGRNNGSSLDQSLLSPKVATMHSIQPDNSQPDNANNSNNPSFLGDQ